MVLAATLAVAAAVAGTVIVGGQPKAAPLTSGPAPSTTFVAPVGSGLTGGVVAEVLKPFSIETDLEVVVGQRVYVAAGPVVRAGAPSVLIQHWGDVVHGLRPASDFGWITAARAAELLRPIAVGCPARPPTLATVSALQPFERLVCFGGATLELAPVTTRLYEVSASSPTWLSSDGTVDFPTGIPYHLAPGIAALDVVGWYAVLGHFDDSSCAAETDPIVATRCRQRFIVTATTPAEPGPVVIRGAWRRMAASPLSGRQGATGAWTGPEMVVWGGDALDADGEYDRTAAAYDATADRWRIVSDSPFRGRTDSVMFATGDRVVVWGGRTSRDESPRRDGAILHVTTGRWTPISAAPVAGQGSAVLAGDRLLVFGDRMRTAAALDLGTLRWTAIATPPLDTGESSLAAFQWTGSELLVVGYPVVDVDTSMAWAASYDPETDRWSPLPDPRVRSIRGGPAVWTGRELVVLWEANRAFNPATGAWRSVRNPCGAAVGGVWTGRYSIENEEAFDTSTDSCRTLAPEPERPSHGDRASAVEVWTGREIIRWSGGDGGEAVEGPWGNDGVIFRPEEDLSR
jgi:hypothetical protein